MKNKFDLIFFLLILTAIGFLPSVEGGTIDVEVTETTSINNDFISSLSNNISVSYEDEQYKISFNGEISDFSYFFKNLFMNLNPIIEIYFMDDQVPGIKNMEGMFSGLTNLEKIVYLYNIDTSKVTNMANMFSECRSLSSLDLSNFDTKLVRNMSNMFSNCSSLESIVLSNFDTSSVIDMGYMFCSDCALNEANVANFNTSKVTNMEYMFSSMFCFAF